MRHIQTATINALAESLTPRPNPNLAPDPEAFGETLEALTGIAAELGITDLGSLGQADQLRLTNRFVDSTYPEIDDETPAEKSALADALADAQPVLKQRVDFDLVGKFESGETVAAKVNIEFGEGLGLQVATLFANADLPTEIFHALLEDGDEAALEFGIEKGIIEKGGDAK